MPFLDRLSSPKFDFTQNQSSGKMFSVRKSSLNFTFLKFLEHSVPVGSNLLKAPSVSIGPGAIQFILIPYLPHSTPRDLKKIVKTISNHDFMNFSWIHLLHHGFNSRFCTSTWTYKSRSFVGVMSGDSQKYSSLLSLNHSFTNI